LKVDYEKIMTDVETKFKAALDVIHRLPDDGKIKSVISVVVFCFYM